MCSRNWAVSVTVFSCIQTGWKQAFCPQPKDMATDHFQLEDGRTVLGLLSPGDFFGKVDFDLAYYSVAIHPAGRKFSALRFRVDSLNSLVFRLGCVPAHGCSPNYLNRRSSLCDVKGFGQ